MTIGMIAPASTPKDIIARLNRESVQIIRQKDVADHLLQDGTVPSPSGAQAFGAYIRAETDQWGAVVRAAQISAE
ncbi:MAG TPA: tripartite tricarboxylate transporter substrate-binding protein [Burkholderiales bacterium]|nr:tripartite tricarboxylate transporter substrate-binding protein [Burkholderiales bacterium]